MDNITKMYVKKAATPIEMNPPKKVFISGYFPTLRAAGAAKKSNSLMIPYVPFLIVLIYVYL